MVLVADNDYHEFDLIETLYYLKSQVTSLILIGEKSTGGSLEQKVTSFKAQHNLLFPVTQEEQEHEESLKNFVSRLIKGQRHEELAYLCHRQNSCEQVLIQTTFLICGYSLLLSGGSKISKIFGNEITQEAKKSDTALEALLFPLFVSKKEYDRKKLEKRRMRVEHIMGEYKTFKKIKKALRRDLADFPLYNHTEMLKTLSDLGRPGEDLESIDLALFSDTLHAEYLYWCLLPKLDCHIWFRPKLFFKQERCKVSADIVVLTATTMLLLFLKEPETVFAGGLLDSVLPVQIAICKKTDGKREVPCNNVRYFYYTASQQLAKTAQELADFIATVS